MLIALLKSVPIMIFSIAHQDSQLVIEVFSHLLLMLHSKTL